MTTSRTLDLLRAADADFDKKLLAARGRNESWRQLSEWIYSTYDVDVSPSWVRWIHAQLLE